MATPYTHGAYGELAASAVPDVEESSTAVVAIGTLPVNLAADYSGMVGAPIRLDNAADKGTYGYSADWTKFTLCEAVQAFLGNSSGNVGPLWAINALDPDTMRETDKTEATVALENGVGWIDDDLCIVKTVKVTGDADATAAYDRTTGKVAVRTGASGTSAQVEYHRVKPSAVTAAQVAAAAAAVDDIYPLHNAVPSLIIAPGWGDVPSVYEALVEKAQSVDGHFLAFVLADIPDTASTIEAAVAWKAANGYTSKHSKACWPRVAGPDGAVYHISTLFAREMARNDEAADGVPYVTASNTEVPGMRVCRADGTAVRMYNEEGNRLNEHGISTAIAWGGTVRLWGGHTCAYGSGAAGDGSEIFDTTIRMLCYVVDSFQVEYLPSIDRPMTLALRDSILYAEQQRLDGLAAQGAFVGEPSVSWLPSSNPSGDIAEGVFVWDIAATPTPQFKTARAVVTYSTDGLDAYLEEGDED